MVAIEQNIIYIVIAAVVVVGIIVVLMRRRRTRKGQRNVNKYLAKEAELTKIEIVEKDLGFKRIMGEGVLLKGQQEKLSDIREITSDLMHKLLYFNSNIDEKVNRLEAKRESVNLQKLLMDIDKREKELNKKTGKNKKK